MSWPISRRREGKTVKFFRNIWSQLHRFVFWALLFAMLWSWIYASFIEDTTRNKKVLICADAYELDQRGLSIRLEDEGIPDGLRMIRVRSFGYNLFSDDIEGDAYLMKESLLRATLEETPDKLTAIEVPEGFSGIGIICKRNDGARQTP